MFSIDRIKSYIAATREDYAQRLAEEKADEELAGPEMSRTQLKEFAQQMELIEDIVDVLETMSCDELERLLNQISLAQFMKP